MANASPAQSEGPRESPQSGELSGITEMFGLRDGQGDTGAHTGADTDGRWVSATEGTVYGSGDASGRLVRGRYRLIAELGAGGMGVTYRAWDTQAGIPVVVKMPKREVRHDREVMTRFAREIEAMRAVPHPSIVPITDSGDDSGCPFVAMRFLPGGSLADYRRRDESDRPIKNPPGMLFFWLPGVAEALDHIHARRMLHRDVKPGNIFLDGFLKPYLGDFGIAKVVDDSGGLQKEQTLTATKMAVGTPEYMAPELFKPRSQLDGRVDQYALAVTVYEMLCGEKPFIGSTAHIIVEHSSLPVPPLERRCPGLPRSVYDAVHRALSKKPEERFATCGQFAEAALLDLKPLTPEADTVRLLCPSCKNILKMPNRAAGRSGKCPRCQTALDVAADLGSLWLESEERGGGLAATEGTATPPAPREQLDEQAPPSAPAIRWGAVLVGVAGTSLALFLFGTFWLTLGRSLERERIVLQRDEEVRSLQATLDAEKTSLRDAEGKIKDLEQRVQDRDKTIADLEKVKAERESLAAENRRLSEARSDARTAPGNPAKVPPEKESSSGPMAMAATAGRGGSMDGVDIEFVAIPAGKFTMGSPPSESGHRPWEKQVEVTITEAFEIGKHEVTQRQWTKVMSTSPWTNYAQGAEGSDIPAHCVGWELAMQFCKALTEKGHANGTLPTSKVYRLPTEAEWEYACRAGTTTAFSFGDDAALMDRYGWADGKPARAVGLKKPNAWGIFDMHGNVSEWCLDWNDMKPLAGGDDPLGPEPGSQHMQRGGHSRVQAGWTHRSAYRKDHGTSGSDTEGFRVVRGSSLPITPPAPATKQAVRPPPPKPLEAGEIFTLSDEALLALDFQPRAGQTARITKRLDVPGPGVEFDITFAGNVDADCGGEWICRVSNDPSLATLSTELAPYRAFALQFELLGVDGRRPAAFEAPLIVGSKIAGYRPEVIHTTSQQQAVSVTSFHESFKPLRELGFVVNVPGWWYEKDPGKNPWPKKGCVVHLRVSPAPKAVPLPLRRHGKADQ